MRMIFDKEVFITDRQRELAKKLMLKKELKNSVMEGTRNFQGVLAEIVVFDYYPSGDHDPTYNHDGWILDASVDVKMIYFAPKYVLNPMWGCVIFDINTAQDCDYYCFTSLAKDHKRLYIHGFLPPEVFYANAEFGRKGEVNPNSSKGIFTFRGDCWFMTIASLKILAENM